MLSSDLISFLHFYCLPHPKILSSESFFLSWALSSQTLFLIKQINIWSKGASTRTQPSQAGEPLRPTELDTAGESGRKEQSQFRWDFLIVWNKFSAGKCSPNLTSFGEENYTAMINFMTVSFFLLDASIRMFFRGNLWEAEVLFHWSVEITGHVFGLFFFFFSSGLKQREKSRNEGGGQQCGYFVHMQTHISDVHCLSLFTIWFTDANQMFTVWVLGRHSFNSSRVVAACRGKKSRKKFIFCNI